MTTEVLLPDGTTGVFGDDMSDAEIKGVIRQQFPPSKLPKATSKSAASNSRMAGPFDNDQGNILWQEYQTSKDPKDRAALEKEAARLGLTFPTQATALPKATAAKSGRSIYDAGVDPSSAPPSPGFLQSTGRGGADIMAGFGKVGSTLLAPIDLAADLFKREPFGSTNRARRSAIDEFAREHGANNWSSLVNQAAPEMALTGGPLARVEGAVTKGAPLMVPKLKKALGVGADVGINAAYAAANAAAEGGDILGAFKQAAMFGAGARGLFEGVAGLVKSPVPSHLARYLEANGIPVTAGMLYPKSWVSALEDMARKVPFVGTQVQRAQENVAGTYINRYANDALQSLSDAVPYRTTEVPPPRPPGGMPPRPSAPQPRPQPQTPTQQLPPGPQAPTQQLPPYIHPVPPDFQPGQGGPLVVDPRGNAGVPAVGPTYEPLHQQRLADPTVPMAERVPPEGLPPPGPGTGMVDMEPQYTPVWQKRLGDPTTPMVEEVPPGALPPPGQNPALGGPQGPGGGVPPRDWPEGPTGPDQQALPGPQPAPGATPGAGPEVRGTGTSQFRGFPGMDDVTDLNLQYRNQPRARPVQGEGIELMRDVQQQISDAYDAVIPHTSLGKREGLRALMNAYDNLSSVAFLTREQRDMVRRFVNSRLVPQLRNLGPNGSLSGRTIKDFDSLIGEKARSYLDSAEHRPIAEALFDIQHALRQSMQGRTPQHKIALEGANEAYRKALPLIRATEAAVGNSGVPTAVHLRKAMQHYDIRPSKLDDAMAQAAPKISGRYGDIDYWIRRGIGGLGLGLGAGGYLGGLSGAGMTLAGLGIASKVLTPERVKDIVGSLNKLREYAPYATQVGREASE